MPEGGAQANRLVLGFDFGTKRIGVAVGQEMLGTARPVSTLTFLENAHRFAAIQKLIEEWHPDLLVVGLPMNVDGTEHEMTQRCRRFGNQLHGRFNLPVTWVDERLSSAEAEQRLQQAGQSARATKANVDAVAAQILLQQWLDQQAARTEHQTGGAHA